jgi:hypothetical protein
MDIDGIALTHHCIERFHERFRPALDRVAARRELEALIAHGEIAGEPPDWMKRTMRQEAEAYLIVGEDLVLPLASVGLGDLPAIAKTCIGRGGISEKARANRNRRRRARRGGGGRRASRRRRR